MSEQIVPRTVTGDEAHAIFDAQARRYLGMSGEDFLRAWDAGEFADIADESRVVRVSMLIRLVR